MAKQSKLSGRTVDGALRKAFEAVETQPAPPVFAEHIDRIIAPARRPDRRS